MSLNLERLFVEFMFYSFLGWIWETVYCTTKEKQFQNRGFLWGPICPIYGVGTLVVQLVFGYLPFFSFDKTPIWQIFLVCSIGSAVLEYTTSYVLEKRFHAMWWDYSNTPLNLNGRICLPASVGFGVVGVLCVRYVLPFFIRMHSYIPDPVNQFLALLLMGLFGADLALTVASLTSLLDQIAQVQQEFIERGEATYTTVANGMHTVKEGVKGGVKGVANVAGDVASGVANGVSTVVGGVASGVSTVAGGVANGVSTVAGGVANGVSTVAGGVVNGVTTVAGGVATGVGLVKATVKNTRSAAKNEAEKIREREEQLEEDIRQREAQLEDKIRERVEGHTPFENMTLKRVETFKPGKRFSAAGVAQSMKKLAKSARWDRKSHTYHVDAEKDTASDPDVNSKAEK